MPPDRTPTLEYENAIPVRAGWQPRWPWTLVVSVVSASAVAFFFAIGLLCQSRSDAEYLALAVWGAAVAYVVARSCAGEARWWIKGQRAVSAAIAAMSGIDVFLSDGDFIYSMKAAYTHGWRIVYVPPIRQAEIVVMLVAIGWFSVVGVWDWVGQRGRRD